MKKILRLLGLSLVAIAALALAAYGVAWWVAKSRYERVYAAHEAEFPIPFPLAEAELAALRQERIAAGANSDDPLAGVDVQAIALERAIARGRHLIESRVSCNVCHGQDFGGGAVVDVPIVGRWVAPNLTAGQGSVTRGYTASDWDRAVRHGLRRDGRTSSMPAIDFVNLSDHELSDIVAYIQSRPPVDRDLGPVKFGPVFTFLVATDPDAFSASGIDHVRPHAALPPPAEPSVEYGRHLVQVCRGCHGEGLSGGKLKGDPHMPIVANLTPHETGLANWSEAEFIRAMREGKRKDGTPISEYMPWKSYGQLGDTELKAMYAYLRTLAPVEKGNR
jgi:mono/diheme cytochrome c family protein